MTEGGSHGTGTVLSVATVSKRFARSLSTARRHGLTDIVDELRNRHRPDRPELRGDEFWAVDDVSLELEAGEALGIVGANGAGKSTLLRIVDGLTKPTHGRVRVVGRPAALIGLGSAFDPVLTGREAIRAEASALGLGSRATEDLEQRVVDFAELGSFIDAPILGYSTGMRMRLGYSIAVQADPDLMLIDEVLAVGDVAFQHKCIRHVRSYVQRGGSLVLVTHDMWMVQQICDAVVVVDGGGIAYAGPTDAGIEVFLDMQAREHSSQATDPLVVRPPGPVRVDSLVVEAADGGPPHSRQPADVALTVTTSERLAVRWGISIIPAAQMVCLSSASDPEAHVLEPGTTELRVHLPSLPLVGGSYLCRAAVLDADTGAAVGSIGWDDPPLPFVVADEGSRETNIRRIGKTLLHLSAEPLLL